MWREKAAVAATTGQKQHTHTQRKTVNQPISRHLWPQFSPPTLAAWLLYCPRPQRRAFAFPSFASSFSSVHSIHSLPIRFISLPFLFAFGFFVLGQMNVFVWTLLQHCASSPPIQCGPTNSTNINEEGNAPNDGFGTIARLEASITKIPLFFFFSSKAIRPSSIHFSWVLPLHQKSPQNFPLPPSPFVFFLFVWPLRYLNPWPPLKKWSFRAKRRMGRKPGRGYKEMQLGERKVCRGFLVHQFFVTSIFWPIFFPLNLIAIFWPRL